MKLTNQQRRYLEWYRNHKERDPTRLRSIASDWRVFLALFALWIIVSVPASMLIQSPLPTIVGFFIVAGATVATVGLGFARCRIWPATKRVIDWEKLEQILSLENKDNETTGPHHGKR
jgi:hypothetical protein